MKKLLLAVVALISLVGCSADPEAKTAKEWIKEVLIEEYYVGDDGVIFHFEDDYEVYAGGENLGNYVRHHGDYIAFLSVDVIQMNGGIIKKYYAFIQWEEEINLSNLFLKPQDQKISEEYIVDFEIEEE